MYTPQCPKCFYHTEHIYTFELKKGKQWVIERCPNCEYAGWDSNPMTYNEYLAEKRKRFIKLDE
jgi:predicted secreted protein